MKIGKRIFYDIATGNIIVERAEAEGFIKETTVEHDIATLTALTERKRDTFDVLELEYGQYAQDFAESNGYRVNPETKTLEFSYPDPSEPDVEQPYQAPLSEQIAANTDYLLDVDFRLMMVELGMN